MEKITCMTQNDASTYDVVKDMLRGLPYYDKFFEKDKVCPEYMLGAYYGDSQHDFYVVRSVLHAINSSCYIDYDAKMDAKYQEYMQNNKGKTVFGFIMEHIDGMETKSGNTYNSEYSFLDRDVNYLCFDDIDGYHYAIMSIHKGDDIRAGYSRARVFSIDLDAFETDFERIDLSCDCYQGTKITDNWEFYSQDPPYDTQIETHSLYGMPLTWVHDKKRAYCTTCNCAIAL